VSASTADIERNRVISAELSRAQSLRMQMLELFPFWGFLLVQVRLVPDAELECIAATDCVRHIWFNPLKTRHLNHRQMGFVLAHEVGHQVFASAERRRGRNAHLWNCATDYAINRIVAGMRDPATGRGQYEAPEGAIPGLGEIRILLDPRFDGRIAEAIYEELAEDALPEPISVTLSLARPDENGGTEGGAAGSNGVRVRLPGCTDHGGGIDIHLPGGLTPEQRDEVRDRLGAALARSAEDDDPGAVPGEWLRRLGVGGPPRVPWRRLFRAYAGEATAKDDYSLARPNRRYLDQDIVVPGLHGERAGHVVVAVDTSGSISVAQLTAVAAELLELSRSVEEMTLIVADAKVQRVIQSPDLPAFLRSGRMRGGGGTDHRPVFDWIAEHRLRPDLFVGLTDLFTRFPRRRPPYPVLWVAPAEHGAAPWGRVVTLNSD